MAKNLKVVLLGYMASGKSTIGKQLATVLGLPFIDLDEAIENDTGKTITQLFDENGALFFRKKEATVLNNLLDGTEDFVLSLGGGTPCYYQNMEDILAKTKNSFYLKLSIGNLVARIAGQKESRPLVASIEDDELPEFVGKHLFERNQFYNRANYFINCDERSIAEITAEIAKKLV